MTTPAHRHLTAVVLVLASCLFAAGCGDDTGDSAESTSTASTDSAEVVATDEVVEPESDGEAQDGSTSDPTTAPAPTTAQLERLAERPAGEDGLRVAAKRARLVARDSSFGTVLFDANGQVVYAFENDSDQQTACTSDDCVTAWPPMLTDGAPTAGPGVDAAALSTITRPDSSKQVTYHGRPLYFYEHEAPGEIKCHNVNLHGGLWWVVTPDGENA